jgi:anti-sigma B factor antagonist
MNSGFDIVDQIDDGIRVVAINGELDLSRADLAREPLERAAADDLPLAIDLSGCEFIDSTGLATIVHATRPLRDGGRKVLVVCPEGEVRQLLRLSAIDISFEVVDSREAARSALLNGG